MTDFAYVVEVYFRKFTEDKAQSLGLVGFVKNEENGTVIGVAEGDHLKIKEFWLNTGSPMSSVQKVEDKFEDISTLSYKDFGIKRVPKTGAAAKVAPKAPSATSGAKATPQAAPKVVKKAPTKTPFCC